MSVVITCYNQAHFLSESIESVLIQTHACHELIVVDDGSADDPKSVAARFPEVRYIRQGTQGVAAARNTGWRESRGDFLVFLDADDRLLPQALETGYDCLQADPHLGLVFGHGRLIGPTGDELLPNPLPVVREAGGYRELLERNPMAFPALVMFRRSAVESVGGFSSVLNGTRIDNASDYDLYLRIAHRFPIQCHPETIAEWRQHGTNTSRNSSMMLRTTVAVLKGQQAFIAGDRAYRAARHVGLERARKHYGEQLVAELRAEARAASLRWHWFGRSVLTLLVHYPEGLLANAFRKVRRTLSRQARESGATTGSVPLRALSEAPLVSVIIPCYNQGHFLTDAIESALGQTYPRVEVVVIDDGSTDGTSSIASVYENVRCLRQENQGLARARNRGLEVSAGECVVFLDSDDRLRPRAIETGVAALKRCPAAAFSYGWSALIDVDGTFLGPAPQRSVEGDHYLPLLRGHMIANPAAMMFRTEALEATGGFRVGVNGVEDYDLCLRLARLYGATACREVVADYRQHDASLSRNIAVMSESMGRVLQSQVAYVSGDPAREQALRQGLRKWRRGYRTEALVLSVRENARAGRWALAAQDAVLLLRSNPRALVENLVRKLKVEVARSRHS